MSPPSIPAPRHSPGRWLLFAIGWIFVGLGLAGTLLPVLPTTPFLLLALWAFSRSSTRFHAWLYNHPWLGPPLQRWQRERSLPLWVKLLAISSMAASLLYVSLLVHPPRWALGAMAAVMAAGAVYLARLPTRR